MTAKMLNITANLDFMGYQNLMYKNNNHDIEYKQLSDSSFQYDLIILLKLFVINFLWININPNKKRQIN